MSCSSGFKVIIPARYASVRLPGKPLREIAGKPMLQHVYENATGSGAAQVIVATDSQRVYEAALEFGAEAHMTSGDHRSGTERIAQVVAERNEPAESIIVNVQGDEPLLPPAAITQVAELLGADPRTDIATLCEQISDPSELFDPAVVKVVLAADGTALYFSRAPIPWHRDGFGAQTPQLPADTSYYRHVGLYAYRVSYLLSFVRQAPSDLEEIESLEQLRSLYHGARVVVSEAVQSTGTGVDTDQDLERVRAIMGG